jgi:uncharacterized membrane protein YbhN (UPF0104 family)
MTSNEGRGPDSLREDEEIEERGAALLGDRRRLVTGLLALVLVVVAIYVVFPNIVGLNDALHKFGDAVWYWLFVAVAFTAASFVAYVALFRGILGGTRDDELHRRLDVRASYQITMAGLAATRIFSAGGAGGIALTYWALRKAGMARRRAACRMVAFLAIMYSIYLIALVLFGVLLRSGALPGENPVGGTIVPAAIAGSALVVIGLIALIPGDIERRLRELSRGYRRRRSSDFVARLASGPATVATGIRTAMDYLRHPKRGALAVGGAAGFWGANIGVLWASFEAFGGEVAFAVLVQGFFVGMAANLIPSPAGGVGTVDAGMIAAFLLFGIGSATVFPAVLVYRVMAFWLPIPPGIVAYFQLRRTVQGWERQTESYTIQSKVPAEAT